MVCFNRTALMYASLLGLSTTVDMLLKRGANPHLTDSNDHTGMHQVTVASDLQPLSSS